jgi:transmembrane sensor
LKRAQKINREAADWLAERDAGPLTAERERLFRAWLEAHDRHAAAFFRLQTCWEYAERFRELRSRDQPLNLDLLEGYVPRRRRVPRWFWVSTLACVLLATGVWIDLFRHTRDSSYSTSVGGIAHIPLPDGSQMTLNTASAVRVHFSANAREITLVQGEAQFTVAHDVTRPFDVHAGDKTIRALGTAFAVRRLLGNNVKVIVTAGRVAVVYPTVKLTDIKVTAVPTVLPTVSAGELAEVGERALAVHELGAGTAQALPWTQGRLWFDRVTLAEAVAEFNRYNRRQFVISDARIAQLRIGGTFDTQDTLSFAVALRSFGIRVDESDPDTLTLSEVDPHP